MRRGSRARLQRCHQGSAGAAVSPFSRHGWRPQAHARPLPWPSAPPRAPRRPAACRRRTGACAAARPAGAEAAPPIGGQWAAAPEPDPGPRARSEVRQAHAAPMGLPVHALGTRRPGPPAAARGRPPRPLGARAVQLRR